MNHLMLKWTPNTLATTTKGTWYDLTHTENLPHPNPRFISNTKQIQPNDMFIAFKGERFDAHDFLADAVKLGATAVITQRYVADLGVPQLVVNDTRLAFGQISKAWRNQYQQLTVVALTGSSGKTTTKEMLGSILSQHAPTLMTRGNLNNDLGVPMMLLELLPEHAYAVMELGANHIGEIAYTTDLVQPKVAGVLNIGTAHVGEFGGREGIARAKSEIFQGLTAEGVAVVPAEGDFFEMIQDSAYQKTSNVLRFGGDASNSDVFATDIILNPTDSHFLLNTPQGAIQIHLNFAGAHNIQNALASSAFALALNIPLLMIESGLANAETVKGRLVFHSHAPYLFIDDTYNANPHSMRAAADVLASQSGYKVMVLGDMGELGEAVTEEHRLLGEAIAEKNIDHLICVGQYAPMTCAGFQSVTGDASPKVAQAFATQAEALDVLTALLDHKSTVDEATAQHAVSVLFKGSRSASIENLLYPLLEKY